MFTLFYFNQLRLKKAVKHHMNHQFSTFTVILSVSFSLCGVFSLITEQSLVFKDTSASIFTPAYGKLSQTTPPSLFSLAITACCFIYTIYINLISISVGLHNHLSMWTFQEATPPLRLSARCLPSRTSLKAFLSSRGSANSDQQHSGLCSVLHFPLIRPRSSTSSNTKSTLGPRVLPKLPQKGRFLLSRKLPRRRALLTTLLFSVVALRKIDTIHHPSVDKSIQPPEVFPKSPPATDTPQKTPVADRPQLGDLPPKPQPSELPPKPGELPPKPQLSDLPPKPQLGDLPPKPHLKDLPPKPHLADIPPKPGTAESAPRPPPGDTLQRPQTQPPPPPQTQPHPQPQDSPSPNQQVTIATPPQPAAEDTNGTPAGLAETPVPLPRKINTVWNPEGFPECSC